MADNDGDAYPNWMEYFADTHPWDEDSYLAFLDIGMGPTNLNIHWQGGVEATPYIEHCTNLVSPNWRRIYTNHPPTVVSNRLETLPLVQGGSYRLTVER
ncbi:MAG: hypothetical protein AAF492_20190 [Verrucomicrobiota bacterium]